MSIIRTNKIYRRTHHVGKTRTAALLLSILLVLSFVGCGTNDQNKDSDSLTKVRFLLDWLPNTNHTGVYAAASLGYYEEEGLDVEIIQPGEGSALSLVAAGKADFCVTFQEEIAAALSSDSPLPVQAVATLIQHNTSGIISLAEKNIVKPADMQGHSYATWDTPIEKAILGALIKEDGGDFSQVEMIPNTVTDVVTALKTDIDMVWIYYAWDGIATELSGLETNFIDFGKEDSALDFYTPVLAAADNFLTEISETAEAFLRATAKGYEYAISNPDAAADILLEAAPELDPELVKASQSWLKDQYKAEVAVWGYISQDRWDRFMNWMFENELIGNKLDSGAGFTNEYLKD
ncbi:MAG: ABC transporter substrate-binding protein [Clostridiaceae bacterium]|nr:ABC transporter substrate-binding protein [Clostridiaceae bacterium]